MLRTWQLLFTALVIARATGRVAVMLGATCLIALVAVIRVGPAADEASVIVTLIRQSATPVVVDHFDLLTRLPEQSGDRRSRRGRMTRRLNPPRTVTPAPRLVA